MISNQARKSASMLIMCEGENTQDIKVLLLTRSKDSRVWPNALVFPGGLSEDVDEQIGREFLEKEQEKPKIEQYLNHLSETSVRYLEWGMSDPVSWYSTLGTALRETKEECGIDLCKVSQEHSVQIVGSLNIIAHWLTPNLLKKRYDTFIWGVQLNHECQDLQVDNVEISQAKWWGIADALEAYERTEVDLPVPTLMILSELEYLQDQLGSEVSIARLLNILATTPHSQAIQPIIVKGEGVNLYLPGDQDYALHAQQGEQEANIQREFWKTKTQRLSQKKIQLKSDSKPIVRWYRVMNA